MTFVDAGAITNTLMEKCTITKVHVQEAITYAKTMQ